MTPVGSAGVPLSHRRRIVAALVDAMASQRGLAAAERAVDSIVTLEGRIALHAKAPADYAAKMGGVLDTALRGTAQAPAADAAEPVQRAAGARKRPRDAAAAASASSPSGPSPVRTPNALDWLAPSARVDGQSAPGAAALPSLRASVALDRAALVREAERRRLEELKARAAQEQDRLASMTIQERRVVVRARPCALHGPPCIG